MPEKSPQSRFLRRVAGSVDGALHKAPAVDGHFQELAKDIHESNKSIASPCEQEDTEQCNWAFDMLWSDEKKDLIKRSKRLIALIMEKDPLKTISKGGNAK